MLSGGVEIWQGTVPTWEGDANGHMNIRFYISKTMDGLVALAAELGMPDAFKAGSPTTFIVREQHARLIREARVTDPVRMLGGVLETTETEALLFCLLLHLDGRISASFQTWVEHVNSVDETPTPWPAEFLARAEALKVDVPEAAAPRSLNLEPMVSQASLPRAVELGMMRSGLGAVAVRDCDAFGRMRAEQLLGYTSDGTPNMFSDGPPKGERTLGGAALEFRLRHHAWPRAGDRYELRSGCSYADPRIRRQVHWMLDPQSGKPWGSTEVVSVTVDMALRKMIVLEGAALEQAKAECIEGLTI